MESIGASLRERDEREAFERECVEEGLLEVLENVLDNPCGNCWSNDPYKDGEPDCCMYAREAREMIARARGEEKKAPPATLRCRVCSNEWDRTMRPPRCPALTEGRCESVNRHCLVCSARLVQQEDEDQAEFYERDHCIVCQRHDPDPERAKADAGDEAYHERKEAGLL